MKYLELLISEADLTVLEHAIGRTWSCYGMEAGAQAGAYALGCVFVQLSDRALTLEAELIAADIDRGEEEFSHILILDGAVGEEGARRAGNLFRHEAGQVITGIYVVRDTLTGTADDTPTFSLTMDTSIIFEFSSLAAIAFTKASYFSDDFFITRATCLDDLEIFDGSCEWESDLEVQYSQSRTMFSVTDLLSD